LQNMSQARLNHHFVLALDVGTRIEQEVGSSYSKQKNRMLRFGKLECLISSIPLAVRGTVDFNEKALPPTK
jgi:hypothetical protein